MSELLRSFSSIFTPHLAFVAQAIVATLLVLWGSPINKKLKQWMKGMPFVVRTFVFILMCAIGYGILAGYMVPLIVDLLKSIPLDYLGLIILLLFIILGVWIERKA